MTKAKKGLRLIDAPIYRYWQALFLSFFSSKLYIDVYKRWRGCGILYLFLIFSIALIPFSLRTILAFNQFYDEQLIYPILSLPTLNIEDGKVVFHKHMPYLIKNPKGEVVAIIDTTGVVKTINNKKYPHLVWFIAEDEVSFKTPNTDAYFNTSTFKISKVYTQSLKDQIDQVFNAKESFKPASILWLKYITDIMIYPVFLSLFFGTFVVFMLFFSFFGQLLSIIVFKFRLTYREACRLYMVASTPQLTLFFLLLCLHYKFPYSGIVFMSIAAVYFSYAVLAVKRDSQHMVLK